MKLIGTRKLKRFLAMHVIYRNNKFKKKIIYDWKSVPYNRTSIVNYACSITNAKDYLEIGCFDDATFNCVFAPNKIGVDPQCGGTHRLTSDEFFAKNKQKFDVIFIDGLHEYHQVHKDVANSLKVLKNGGFIVLDDMMPLNWRTEHVPQFNYNAWMGDVWKVAFEIQATKGLDFKLFLADDGVGVIKPQSKHEKLTDMKTEIGNKRFQYLYEHHKNLPLINVKDGFNWMQS